MNIYSLAVAEQFVKPLIDNGVSKVVHYIEDKRFCDGFGQTRTTIA